MHGAMLKVLSSKSLQTWICTCVKKKKKKKKYNIKSILLRNAICYWNTEEEAVNCQKKAGGGKERYIWGM